MASEARNSSCARIHAAQTLTAVVGLAGILVPPEPGTLACVKPWGVSETHNSIDNNRSAIFFAIGASVFSLTASMAMPTKCRTVIAHSAGRMLVSISQSRLQGFTFLDGFFTSS